MRSKDNKGDYMFYILIANCEFMTNKIYKIVSNDWVIRHYVAPAQNKSLK